MTTDIYVLMKLRKLGDGRYRVGTRICDSGNNLLAPSPDLEEQSQEPFFRSSGELLTEISRRMRRAPGDDTSIFASGNGELNFLGVRLSSSTQQLYDSSPGDVRQIIDRERKKYSDWVGFHIKLHNERLQYQMQDSAKDAEDSTQDLLI